MASGRAFILRSPGAPLEQVPWEPRPPAAHEAVVRIAGCGVCHTDLGFLDGAVKPRAALPLVLGHEIAGTVVETGRDARAWLGQDVVVAAVIACGTCSACQRGRGNVCASQFMPGNDGDGGFATHVTVSARGLTAIPSLPAGSSLADFAVIADAVTTALQATTRARVGPGDFVAVVGTGGVGTHLVQVAAAAGADVVGIDVSEARLVPLLAHGAKAVIDARGLSSRDVRARVRDAARSLDKREAGWKVFECSGTTAGQETAWSLLTSAGVLGIVGFTREPVSIRLSNLMAHDADAFGSWGCPPELYPEAVELARSGRIALAPFVRHVPLDAVRQAVAEIHRGDDPRRVVLVP